METNTATETTKTTADGRPFPFLGETLLSWDIGTYNTFSEGAADYPKMRAVIRAMMVHRPEQLERERREMVKASFNSMFGMNAKRVLDVIASELIETACQSALRGYIASEGK